ncbi:MAG: rhodanese-like domain-containing protein [Prevotella sp.]|nr:rhodanese-like domain-containing protein [Prevotella sp.]
MKQSNKLTLIVLLAIVLGIAWTLRGHDAPRKDYKTVDVQAFHRLISGSDSVVLLDVRTASEHEEAYLKGSLLIDYKADSFMSAALSQLPKNKTIAIYCRSGIRSASAAKFLAKEGYKVVNMDGGTDAWIEAGKPVLSKK